jgi:NADH-quinone oxidoreductase subunit H
MSALIPVLVGAIVASVAMGLAAWGTWYERKFAGRMQNRPGPTEVGPAGLLQPFADLLKLVQKEVIVPRAASRRLFMLAPVLIAIAPLALFAVVPWSRTISIAADLHIGLLWVFAVGSVAVLPHWIAGWASNNKYALLGAMRAAAQTISYEIPLLLAAMVPIILAGSVNLGDIVAAQEGLRWFALWPPGPGIVAFGLFFMCSLAEANRIPFDIPEAESELIGGIATEYTGLFAGMIQLSEYLHTLVTAALCAALFFGGWDGPFAPGLHWMVLKTIVLYLSVFWIRWSWMRYRSDQLLRICWYYLVPLSLGLVAVTALWVRFAEA